MVHDGSGVARWDSAAAGEEHLNLFINTLSATKEDFQGLLAFDLVKGI